MSEMQELDLLSSFQPHLPSTPPPTPPLQAEPSTGPPSPATLIFRPVRPSPGSRTVSAPGGTIVDLEAVNRVYLRGKEKRRAFSRSTSFSPLSTLSRARQASSAALSFETGSSLNGARSTTHTISAYDYSTPFIWRTPEHVPLHTSIAATVKEPDTPFDYLGLPHNGSEVPFLWAVEAFSCWDMAFRRIIGPLKAMLDAANLLLAQTGISLAGMQGSCAPENMRVVLTILLDEQDVDKVLGLGDVQEGVDALVRQKFTDTPVVPPIRYWVKEQARMEWERERLAGVQTFGGREPMLRKALLRRGGGNAEDALERNRAEAMNRAWRVELTQRIVEEKEKLREERRRAREARAAEVVALQAEALAPKKKGKKEIGVRKAFQALRNL